MNKAKILFIFLFSTLTAFAQNPRGTYTENEDFITFEGDSVDFIITEEGGFLTPLKGSGIFEILENFLVIRTGDYEGETSSYQALEKKNGSATLQVSDRHGKALSQVQIAYLDKAGKVIGGVLTGEDGSVSLDLPGSCEQIKVSYLGYEVIINPEKHYDYHVKLVRGSVLENQILVFYIADANEDLLSLKLLETDFEAGNKMNKRLDKLEGKARNSDFRVRKFTRK